jgi:PAS domain S-box-containing protein
MSASIKKRIYTSYYVLAAIFIINGAITIAALIFNQSKSKHISKVADPSIQALFDFRKLLLESEMYSTNWVFIRSNEQDKSALKAIHNSGYEELKTRLNTLSVNWYQKPMADTLKNLFSSFEQLLLNEKYIMKTLVNFDDYDDPVKKFAAEEMIENEVQPHTMMLRNSLLKLLADEQKVRAEEEGKVELTSLIIRVTIVLLGITILVFVLFYSRYMTKIITRPINKMIDTISRLGKGELTMVDYDGNGDEIGAMIRSVNNLSSKLHSTASFALEIGKRNFKTHFEPLSEKDNLGKALLLMRSNLKASDENLNEAQHIAQLGSWEKIPGTGELHWSDELFNIFEIERNNFDCTFENYLKIIHPDDLQLVKSQGDNYIRTGKLIEYEFRIVTPNGKVKNIQARGKAIFNEKGEAIKIAGTAQDITESVKNKELLQNSESRMRQAQSIAHVGSWELDFAENISTWSEEACRIYGLPTDDNKQTLEGWLSFIHPEDLAYVLEKTKSSQETLSDSSMQHRIVRKDGEIRFIHSESKFEFGNDGRPTGLVGIAQDITEKKLAELAIQESELKFRGLFEKMLDGVYKTSSHGKFIDANPALINMLGYESKEELLTIDIKSQLYFEVSERDQAVTQDEQNGMSVYRLKRKDGSEIWVEDRGQYLKDENGNILYHEGILRDVTKRIKSEEEIRQKNMALQKTNSELDQFVYSVSHDLRAPLSSMLGVINISEVETEEPAILEHLKYLKGSVRKLDTFITDILDYSRNARLDLKKEKINFKDMLNDITTNLKYMSSNGRQVKMDIDISNGVEFYSDKGRVSVLLNNLISNAIRYQDIKTESPFVRIKVDMRDTETNIAISDNGIGISKQNQEKIFNMFYRVSDKSVGSGLGLYIVKETVQKLNGKITVESEEGKGTTFFLNLPNLTNN